MHIESCGRGPDLVLLHGWAMHAGIFAPLRDALAADHTLHLVDLPGHGRSPEREGPLDLADTVDRLLAALPRAAWLGWSLGGLVAIAAARRAPAQVRGLVAIAASPRFVIGPDWPHGVEHAVFAQFARDLATDYPATLERFLALECHGSDCALRELRTLRAAAFAHGEPALHVLEDGLALLADIDLRPALPALPMPGLWLAGARDRLIPWRAMEWAAQAMPLGRFARIAGGGHAPFIGHPDRVLALLRPFLAELPA